MFTRRSPNPYKLLLEAKYLAQDNSYQYRAILRYFYEQQQRY
ncbi:DUF2397 domain-containing protein [Effusibacillus pohliae]|nr:DUF2397 domain-containing protein [Effusibacillus pohliae]